MRKWYLNRKSTSVLRDKKAQIASTLASFVDAGNAGDYRHWHGSWNAYLELHEELKKMVEERADWHKNGMPTWYAD